MSNISKLNGHEAMQTDICKVLF